ncbi:sulfotransferase family protein [Myceligenerans pegani]|uniref:Sulfotransferase n=1 Tax=Myceligenerans pegani TaxID=2776917 RepID=A0ABR9MWR0_9MICO|nr:sulfotransferase [Myceligenerans sp. TRM 65318]MBE1875436.1 sulfotransferase [Myceligenerans sp. TRM 65318]MBE3017707.1 sulfotransferase [Myceligenerans sp. TRM 65318]
MNHTPRTSKVLNTVFAPVVRGYEDPAKDWEKAVAQVEEEAGAEDRKFADDLGRAARSIGEEPRLMPLGWTFALSQIKDRYANRLRINRLLAEHPEIADEPIADPVFVLGLPRTATTLAHRVLAASPAHRGPLMWEMSHTDLEDPAVAAREIRKLDQGSKFVTGLFAPGLKHMHPSRAEQPEESMMLLPHGTFWPLLHGALPSYREWYAQRGPEELAGDYAYLKQGLQVLQHGRERKRWIVKYPGHLNDMPTIKKVFPDATFVWTHRNPTTVLASTCSLVGTMWSMYQKDPDPREVGELVLDTLVTWVDNALESRLSMPPSSIVDVPYHQLAADPHTEVPRVYAAIGATWTTSDAAQLDQVLARPAGTRPHRYDIADYGLGANQVEESFAAYLGLLRNFDRLDAEPTAEM